MRLAARRLLLRLEGLEALPPDIQQRLQPKQQENFGSEGLGLLRLDGPKAMTGSDPMPLAARVLKQREDSWCRGLRGFEDDRRL